MLSTGTSSHSIDPRQNTSRVSCRNTLGGDAIYRIAVAERAALVVKTLSDFAVVLELRGACAGPVVTCGGSREGTQSTLRVDVEAGTYVLVVHAIDEASGGPVTVDLAVTP